MLKSARLRCCLITIYIIHRPVSRLELKRTDFEPDNAVPSSYDLQLRKPTLPVPPKCGGIEENENPAENILTECGPSPTPCFTDETLNFLNVKVVWLLRQRVQCPDSSVFDFQAYEPTRRSRLGDIPAFESQKISVESARIARVWMDGIAIVRVFTAFMGKEDVGRNFFLEGRGVR